MPAVRLSVPQPCHESWAAMTPTATGRHCAACQKTVVDFTRMADAEILAFLAKSPGTLCGRVDASQLERPLQPVAPAGPARWQAWLAGVAAVLGLRELLPVAARAQAVSVEQTARKALDTKHYKGLPAPAKAPMGPLVGQVRDAQTGELLPGVTVRVQDTTVGTSTDADGNFSLPLPAECQSSGMVLLVVGSVGFVTQERWLPASPAAVPLQFLLRSDVKGMIAGEVMVSTPRALPPAPWRPRALYHWSKYWLMRPFRQ